ncbi:hypothetical protein DPEC_G00324480 [Dallia pectoralis]|uniref:Uncharacterized protein n=1 Tax=Dallia pectoralis TaxID=75939 RepID=A0ACC2FAW9_DALPE|nr:hypothetical protein DPEC_G00324480 [Dallia pectoralis]
MGNFRLKLRIAGCSELTVNSEKRRGVGNKSKGKMKKPRRSETNFLPVLPEGKTTTSLEGERSRMQEDMQKRSPDWVTVEAAMLSTFSLRKEIVEDEPLVVDIKSRWPALFTDRQMVTQRTVWWFQRPIAPFPTRNLQFCID